ncbi:MAG: DUF4868 domain-containing protein [Chitinophagaceae bacterium]
MPRSKKAGRRIYLLFWNTFDRLTEDAFVVDNIVNAVYKNRKFYFISYPNANKIFSLASYYKEATNAELTLFGAHVNVSVKNMDWFLQNANTVVRKHITLVQKSKILDGADTKKIKKSAKKFRIKIELNDDGKIIFPEDKKACKDILFYLNEQYYEGPITKKQYQTNSKRSLPKTADE